MTSPPHSETIEDRTHKLLGDLHANLLLSAPAGTGFTAPATAKQLKGLHEAVAALQSLPSNISALSDPCAPITSAVASNLELLLQQLLDPPAAIYSGFGGAPCEPGQELEPAGRICREAAAAQLQLVLLLLRQLGRLQLPTAPDDHAQPAAAAAAAGADRDAGRERNRPRRIVGIVEITEEEDSSSNANTAQQQAHARLQQLVLQVLLACTLYAQQDVTRPPAGNSRRAAQGTSAAAAPSAAAEQQSRPGSNSNSSSSSAPKANNELHADLDSFCHSIVLQGLTLPSPWTSQACQQQCRHILQQVAYAVAAQPSTAARQQHQQQQGSSQAHVADTAAIQQQQGCWQQLLSRLLSQLLDCLRDVLMAQHRHQRAQDTGQLGAYKGPDTFHRCVAARQLAWVTQHLRPHLLPSFVQQPCRSQQQVQPQDVQQEQDRHLVGLLLPLLLAVTDDPSPAVQRYGQAGLGWLGLTASGPASLTGSGFTPSQTSNGVDSPAQLSGLRVSCASRLSDLAQIRAASLKWHRVLLVDVAKRLVVGCKEGNWATAMPAATSLVMALEGSANVRAPAYHQLLQELITEAERGAHKPRQRLIFMGCLGRLLPCIGLYVLRHMAALMSLLLEWIHAYDEASALAAVRLLGCVVRNAWPRVGAHAALLWRQLEEVVRAAEQRWLEAERQEKRIGGADAARGRAQQAEQPSSNDDGGGVGDSALMGAVLEVVGLLAQCGGEGFAAAVAATAAELEVEEGVPCGALGASWVGALVSHAREVQNVPA